MSPEEILKYVKADPFCPFLIRMVNGRTFEIRQPKMVKVTKREVLIYTFYRRSPDVYKTCDDFGLTFIESISPLEASVV